MNSIKHVAKLIIPLVSLTIACAPNETSPGEAAVATATDPAIASASTDPKPRDIAFGIDASKPGLRGETKRRKDGEFDVTETRFYVGNTLVLIEETIIAPSGGANTTAYYFDDERLVFFRGRGSRTIVENGSETRENFDIELGYDFDGKVVDSKKVINGRATSLEPFDYEAPKARAKVLVEGGS